MFGNDQFGADGVDTDNNPTVNVTFTQPPVGQGTVSYNAGTGQFTFTPAAGQQGSTQFTYTITDFDGDTSMATVTVNLQPDSTPVTTNGVAAVDDDGLAGGNAASVTGDLNANTGEAAPVNASEAIFHGQLVATAGGDTITNYTFASMNGTNGTVGTETVLYSWSNGTSTLTATTVGGTRAGTPLFQVVVNQATGEYNLTLLDNVLHTAGANENDATTNLTFTVTDSDTDTANGTIAVTFDDDAPTLGTIQNGTANNNPASALSIGTLHFVVGADSPAAVTAITATNTGVITSGGFNLVTNYSGNVLTAYQDSNGNGVYNVGVDTVQVYTLTVNPAAGTSGQYVFDLITPLDPTVTDAPIGGSSSFGAGPTGYQILQGLDTTDLCVVSGYHMGGTFNEATWLASGNAGPGSNYGGAGVNGSTSGWGIDNNNFNGTDEMFVWDFGSQATRDPDGAGAFVPPVQGPDVLGAPPEVQMPNISYATFELIGYTTAAGDDISYVVHYTDGSFDSGHIPGTDINDGFWTFTADAGKFIGDIEMFASGLGSGKVDLVSVGIQTSNLTETISFNVTLTDADGDPVSGGFTVVVADGSTPSTPAPPVVLDLNGDGVQFLAAEAGVHYDYNGDGHAEATAWVGANDAILVRDANGNGTVDGASEFVFGANGQTDLQALNAQYGSTLDANDADYAKFGVWQDANSNGAVDAGEYSTLANAGIASISLVSDGQAYSAAGGDVDVAGSTTYTNTDGSTGIVADAIFWTGGRAADDQVRVAANSNIALAAAVAAAGLSAAPAAAESNTATSDHASSVAIVSDGLSQQVVERVGAVDGDNARTSLANETRESAFDPNDRGTANHGSDDAAGSRAGLTDVPNGSDGHDAGAVQAIDQGPSFDFAASAAFAPMVAMPAAEALAAAGLTGGSQHGGSVERVLAEALGGAGHAPTIDALLQSLPGQAFGNAGLDALATHGGGNVPTWDMGATGGFNPGADMMIRMDVAMLHHDAVQPVVNG